MSFRPSVTAVLAGLFAAVFTASAQDPAAPDYPDRSLLLVVRDASGGRRTIKTAEDWAIRRGQILAGLQAAMGPLPERAKFPPLDVQVADSTEEDGYRRLRISFAGDEKDCVPAYLLMPPGPRPPQRLPAMLALHQTIGIGKGEVVGLGGSANLHYGRELAQRGYVVLAPDYPSFGDYRYDFQHSAYVSGTMKGIVNHLRAVDVLASLPEVDPERIGVIGHSLGGHNAMFVGAFDPRLKVIVASCGWTPFHDYYGGQIAGWTSDRYMPRLRDVYQLNPDRVPFDFYELVAALAPRGFFSNSPTGDGNFAVAGVKKAEVKAREVFALLGAADRLQVRYPDSGHDFPPAVRREAYAFVDRILNHEPLRDVPARP